MNKLFLLLLLFSCNPKEPTIKPQLSSEKALGKIEEDITKIIECQGAMFYD